jgi:hypothetical protein
MRHVGRPSVGGLYIASQTWYLSAMSISLHPQARAQFDAEAAALRNCLEPAEPPRANDVQGSKAHRYVQKILTEQDLRDEAIIMRAEMPLTGDLVDVFLIEKARCLRLATPASLKLQEHARALADRAELRPYCSATFVEQRLLHWLIRAPSSDHGWTADFLTSLEAAIVEAEYLVPLEGIDLITPFRLGDLELCFITTDMCDHAFPSILGKAPIDSWNTFIGRFREQYQGRACVRYRCRAESTRGQELAIQKADQVVGLLRFYHAAAFDVRIPCNVNRFERGARDITHVIQVQSGAIDGLVDSIATDDAATDTWDEKHLSMARAAGLDVAQLVLLEEDVTPLQRIAYAALQRYARGLASRQVEDRLLQACIAIESILLRNNTEPILDNGARRTARFIAKDIDSRRAVVDDLRKAYRDRSGYVHHGAKASAENIALFNRVASHACAVIVGALCDKHFQSKEDLIDYLDRAMLA